jgi:DNA helicase II / ATP-dependent DNA helicase PcrA
MEEAQGKSSVEDGFSANFGRGVGVAGQVRDWSPFQIAIFDAVKNTQDSLMIEAVAGSGKSTTIIEAINYIPRDQSICFVAFNKSIADELKRRITAPNARCMTLHAVGFAAWRKFLGGNSWECKVDSGKTRSIVQEILSPIERARYGAEISKLISIAKGQGIVPKEQSGTYTGLVEDDDAVWEEIVDFYDLDRDGCNFEVARRVLSFSIETAGAVIDFDDQLYMPIIASANFDKHDVVLLDESQDVNGIQAEMVARMRKPATRIIAVGDPHQAIYGFRGALSNSMTQLKERFRCVSLPLSVSYRCSKAVIRKAQQFVSHIQFHEGSIEGLVEESVKKWVLTDFRPTDVILCRLSRPLIEIAFLLIRNKISCRVLGRDIGQGLIKLVKKMKAFTIEDLIAALQRHRQKEFKRAQLQGKEDKIAALDDKIDTIHVFIDEVGPNGSVEELIASIESLFSDDGTGTGRITLSTIHKSKGLEWDRVFILDAPLYMPFPRARQPWQKEQENNLCYVAITRSKDQTYYISSEVLKACEWQEQNKPPAIAESIKGLGMSVEEFDRD